MATRRRFSAEYKQEAVELARSSNKTASQIARDLGIDPNMLSRWCRELETSPQKAFPGKARHGMRSLPRLSGSLPRSRRNVIF